MSTRFTPLAGVIVLCSVLSACGSARSDRDGTFSPSGRLADDSASSPASGSAVPSTMTTAQIDQAVLTRYREYQQAYKSAYETNDPGRLNEVAVDPLLTIITKDVEATAAKGEIWRFTNVLNPKIQGRSKDNGTVVILDCVRTLGAYRYSARTGKRLGAYGGGTRLYQAVMLYRNGTWSVTEAREGKKC